MFLNILIVLDIFNNYVLIFGNFFSYANCAVLINHVIIYYYFSCETKELTKIINNFQSNKTKQNNKTNIKISTK